MTPGPQTVLEPSPDVVFRDLDGEAVVLHLGTATYFGLDEVGTRAWQLMTDGLPLSSVCDLLAEEFDAPRERIEQDIAALVERLLSKDLLRVVG